MSEGANIQEQIFKLIKNQLPEHVKIAECISDLLQISIDSTYRRLRGEKLLDIGELFTLCKHFKISLESLQGTEVVNFKYTALPADDTSLPVYLNGILKEMKTIASVGQKHIIFTAEDLPIFHYFNYELLTAFKLYYWNKSILNSPQLKGKKFHPNLIDSSLIATAKEIYELYVKIPSTEIWTEKTLQTVLKQIEFYWESGLFEKQEHALEACTQLTQMLSTVQEDATLESKERLTESEINYTLYRSEVTIGNNCIQVSINDLKMIYFSFNTFNSMSTNNHAFCEETNLWIKNLIGKSTQISGTAEKMRHQFFNLLNKQILALEQKIKNQ